MPTSPPAGTPRRLLRALLAVTAWLALATACGTDGPAPTALDDTSLRNPPAGEVIGYTGTYGSHAWRGIPYARPPVGDLRWRAPEPLPRWSTRLEAVRPGSPCPQIASPFAGVVDQEPGTHAGAEDCLYLDVYAPRLAPEAVRGEGTRLPVMVWIHGGGNVIGHAGFYDGGNLAQSQDVVVVAINYRLGPLGFFRHAALRGSGADALDASGNFGLLDQIRALEWVRDNIAAFGGDPENVTIFGESAGGRDVLSLLVSEPARGLFHRAIAQSGAVRYAPAAEAEAFADAEPAGHRNSSNEILLRHLERNAGAAGRADAKAKLAAMSPGEVEALLRAMDPQTLIDLYLTEDTEGLIDAPNVFYDGAVLPAAPPLERYATPGAGSAVPVMLGTNRDEVKVFMFASPEHVERVLWILPRLRDPARFEAVAAIESAAWHVVGADAPAAALVRGGNDDVFVYRFDWDEEPSMLGADLGRMLGAAHGFEIPFVFGHFDLGPQANVVWTDDNLSGRRALSGAMMGYWAEFARSGDPGRGSDGEQPRWARWPGTGPGDAAGEGARIVLDTPGGGGIRMESGRVSPGEVLALVDGHADALGAAGQCEMAERLAERFRGVSTVALERARACREGAGPAGDALARAGSE